MHILVVNDDGPPSPHASPYVHSLVRELQKAGHTVSVCLPHTQRSWIGKAHMIGQTVKPLYYRPPADSDPASVGTTHNRPSAKGDVEEWVLVDGTPASCVQIGLYHFFDSKGPIDLVVSGPNYGRNTTAVFALSSGTLGGALEAAVCKRKSIALSYAFFTRNHDPAIISSATQHSVRVIEALVKQWPTDGSVDLYSINVPLVEGVEGHKTVWTGMLQNYWNEGSCFQEVEGSVGDEEEEEERIRQGEEFDASGEIGDSNTETTKASGLQEANGGGHTHKHFKWAPKFTDVYKSVEEAGPGNDGWAVKEGQTSVTPLKANFCQAAPQLHNEELKLKLQESGAPIPLRGPGNVETAATPSRKDTPSQDHLYAVIAYEDAYVQPLLLSSLELFLPRDRCSIISSIDTASESALANIIPKTATKVLQITPYETIDFEYAAGNPDSCLINSYMIRKALIRKHFLSTTVEHWVAKHPESPLKYHVKRSEAFEVDYAEFLDDALVEAFDLRASMEHNATLPDSGVEAQNREWWILKPSMSDRGQGIRLFSTMDELQGIFDEWEEDMPDSDEEEEEEGEQGEGDATGRSDEDDKKDHITTSHLRHFVAQPYIHPPLLLPGDNRKFHIRTYVLCVGSLQVYIYKSMLALFAAVPYAAPWDDPDLNAHLTNTCLQGEQTALEKDSVKAFWDLPLDRPTLDSIFKQICDVTGELFEAAAKAMTIHFQPLPYAFEVFGVDFLVDAESNVWLLEVNAFPDFKQTGDELRGVVAEFWAGVLRLAVGPFVGSTESQASKTHGGEDDDMVRVREVDLGRR